MTDPFGSVVHIRDLTGHMTTDYLDDLLECNEGIDDKPLCVRKLNLP